MGIPGKTGAAWTNLKAKAGKWSTCAGHSTKAACDADADCGWTKICVIKAAATAATAAITGSTALKALAGSGTKDMTGVMDGIFKGGMASAASVKDKLKDLGAADLKGIAAGLGAEVKNGAKIMKGDIKSMMDKMKGAGGFGATSTWDVDTINEMGGLLVGLAPTDITNLKDDDFASSFDKFGGIGSWAKDQSKNLAGKLKTAFGTADKLTADALKSSQGFLPGLTKDDLKLITNTAFQGAKAAFKANMEKLGSFDKDQMEELKKQVKAEVSDFATMTKAQAEGFGALLATADIGDLKKLPATALGALDAAAFKAMGGAKALGAFTKDQFTSMSAEARKAFNGKDIKALASDKEKLKGALGCTTDCPPAITDFTTTYYAAQKNATDVLAEIKAALVAKDAKFANYPVCGNAKKKCYEMLTTTLLTASTARRTTAAGDEESATRVYAEDSATATSAGTVTGQGTTTTVDVTGTTAVVTTTITQKVTFASLVANTYVGDVKKHYECVYVRVLDTAYCDAVTRTVLSVLTVSSSAARRATAVTFSTGVPSTLKTKEEAKVMATNAKASFATSWASEFAAVNTAAGGTEIADSGAATAEDATFSTGSASAVVPSLLSAALVAIMPLLM